MKKILFPLAMLAMLVACSPKDSAKTKLEKLYTNVDMHSDNFTDEEWLEFGREYHEVDSIINVHEGEYTVEEMNEIKSIKRKCTVYLLKATAVKAKLEVQDGINDLLNELSK